MLPGRAGQPLWENLGRGDNSQVPCEFSTLFFIMFYVVVQSTTGLRNVSLVSFQQYDPKILGFPSLSRPILSHDKSIGLVSVGDGLFRPRCKLVCLRGN